jgi:hypothetical protein
LNNFPSDSDDWTKHYLTASILDKQANDFGEDRYCWAAPYSETTIAGAKGVLHYRLKGHGTSTGGTYLDMIDGAFQRSDYSRVREAIVAKYGEPLLSSKEDFRNKLGGKFTGEVAIWRRPGAVITLHEMSDDIDRSRLMIFNPATQKELDDAAQKKANSDF